MSPPNDVQLENRAIDISPFFERDPRMVWRNLKEISDDGLACDTV